MPCGAISGSGQRDLSQKEGMGLRVVLRHGMGQIFTFESQAYQSGRRGKERSDEPTVVSEMDSASFYASYRHYSAVSRLSVAIAFSLTADFQSAAYFAKTQNILGSGLGRRI